MEQSRFDDVIRDISEVVDREFPILLALPEEVITQRRNKQNRTIKELLGHLVDSASNNHQSNCRHDFEGNKVTPEDMITGYIGHIHLHIGEIHELMEG